MKANELRIGNLIFAGTDAKDKPQAGIILQVFENVIHWSFDISQRSVNDGYNASNLKFVKPIPLTAELLKRCGFEYNAYDGYTYQLGLPNNTGLSFTLPNIEEINYCGQWIDCKYLHQLQNLYFALTGEELEVKP